MDRDFYFMLSLSMKAGKLKSGEEACEELIRSGKAKLVLLADDSSENTKNKFKNKTSFYNVPLAFAGSRERLGKATGKANRVVFVVLDEGFAANLMKRLEDKPPKT
jgi:ribosomal protein L7Ae-like RNA K-turn-binding protein